MSYRSSKKKPSFGVFLFIIVTLILIVLIVVQLAGLAERDGGRGKETEHPNTELTGTDDLAPGETMPQLNLIATDFSTVIKASGNNYLDAWPAESSVEVLRDVTEKLRALQGRASGPTALEGITVILDPGHGGIDGGTAYPQNPPHEIIEKDMVLDIAMRTKSELEALGANVIMTRTTDEFVSVYERAAIAGEFIVDELVRELGQTDKILDPLMDYKQKFQTIYDLNQDVGGGDFMGGAGSSEEARMLYDLGRQFPDVLFLSMHLNSFYGDPNIGGLQVYYVDNAFHYEFSKTQAKADDVLPPVYRNYDDEARLKLATTLSETIMGDLPDLTTVGGPDTLKQDGFVVLNRTGLSSVMLEMAYVTNANDRMNLNSVTFRDSLAESIAKSVHQYYSKP